MRLDEQLGPDPSPLFESAAELAKVYARLCHGDDPVDALRASFRRARTGGFYGFLPPRVVGRLVTAALAHDIEPDFCHELLRAYDLRPGPEALEIAAWPWPVKVRVLGPLQIEIEGRRLSFGRKQPTVPLALLKLLVATGETLTVTHLTHALWPGYGDDAPRGSLDTALYRLRKLLRVDGAIASDPAGIALAEQLCWTDVRAFALCCDAITELTKATGAPAEATLERHERTLLDLYRGPLGADDDPAAIARAREQLGRRYTRATHELGRLWARLGQGARHEQGGQVALAKRS